MARGNYKQCTLERKSDGDTITHVSYIPSELAIPGRNIQLKNGRGDWADIWMVKFASTEVMKGEDFKTAEQLIRGHRQATGDSTKRSSIDGSLGR